METAFGQLQQHETGDIAYELFRATCVKEFQSVVEQSGSLLKKRLRPYWGGNRQADRLTFNTMFRLRRQTTYDLGEVR